MSHGSGGPASGLNASACAEHVAGVCVQSLNQCTLDSGPEHLRLWVDISPSIHSHWELMSNFLTSFPPQTDVRPTLELLRNAGIKVSSGFELLVALKN